MLVIKYSVYNQRLRRITSGIIPSNAYEKLKFEFDFRTDDWDVVETKTANFYYKGENYPIELDENNQCFVPKEVIYAPSFKVSIHGGNIVTNYVQNLVEEIKSSAGITPPSSDEITDGKTYVYVPEVTPDNMLVFTLQDEVTEERLEFDIDKSNDWNETDNTMGSNYIWEPMQ